MPMHHDMLVRPLNVAAAVGRIDQAQAERVDLAGDAASDVGVGVQVRARAMDRQRVGAREPPELGVVVAGPEVDEADLDVLLLARELVVLTERPQRAGR